MLIGLEMVQFERRNERNLGNLGNGPHVELEVISRHYTVVSNINTGPGGTTRKRKVVQIIQSILEPSVPVCEVVVVAQRIHVTLHQHLLSPSHRPSVLSFACLGGRPRAKNNFSRRLPRGAVLLSSWGVRSAADSFGQADWGSRCMLHTIGQVIGEVLKPGLHYCAGRDPIRRAREKIE
jgi:hypothetical protein